MNGNSSNGSDETVERDSAENNGKGLLELGLLREANNVLNMHVFKQILLVWELCREQQRIFNSLSFAYKSICAPINEHCIEGRIG